MKTFFLIFQVITSLVLIFCITIQAKGSGLSGPFAGNFSNFSTKRGVEKFIFYFTVGCAVVFFLSSVAQLIF